MVVVRRWGGRSGVVRLVCGRMTPIRCANDECRSTTTRHVPGCPLQTKFCEGSLRGGGKCHAQVAAVIKGGYFDHDLEVCKVHLGAYDMGVEARGVEAAFYRLKYGVWPSADHDC